MEKVSYKNCIVNFASSIMKNYSQTSEYPTHALTDYLLSKKYRHVAVVLCDGLGMNIIDKNVSNGSILKTNQIMHLNSVFPPTTVAATTAYTTGKAPIESGWLGWHLYLEENDPSIVLFKNKVYATDEPFTKYDVQDKIPTTKFFNKLFRAKGYEIGPSWSANPAYTFAEAIDLLKANLEKDEKNFTYLYWDQPDFLIHEYGTTNPMVKRCIADIEANISRLAENLPDDSIVFVTADHGLIDVEPLVITEYPDFNDTLLKPFAGEGRFAQFYVKEDRKVEFVELFEKYFGEAFTLMTKEEFLESKLSGLYEPNKIVDVALGDYCAIATANYYFVTELKEDDFVMKGHHAGLTKEELEVPVILLKRKENDEE